MVNIKSLLKYSKEDSLIRDSAILFSATLGLSVAGFFFHFYMGRVLGPASYGILGAIFSLFYVILVPFNVIQTSITNFVASFRAKGELDRINVLLRRALKKLFLYGLFVTVLFLLFSPLTAKFLHIPIKPLLIISPIILLSFLLPVMRGMMQGSEKFKVLGINMSIEGVTKIFLGILFVSLGLGVSGAVFALVLSYVVPFIAAFFVLSQYFKHRKAEFNSKEVYMYAIPVIISLVLFTWFYTVDVLLVKRFFSDTEAGLYVALSFVGRIIFFGTQSIAFVMFPKSVANFSLRKHNKRILNKALFLVLFMGGLGTLVYFLLPKVIITIFYGKAYLVISNMAGLFGLIMLMLSLSYVLVFYNLSIRKKNFIYIVTFFLVLEILLIYLYHTSLMQVVLILLILAALMLVALFVYTKYDKTINNNTSIQ